jgi:mRNA interferase RelE/StbE
MKFEILIFPSAEKEMKSLDNKTKDRIKSAAKALGEDPFHSRPKADIRKLHGLKDPELYRLRVGNFRIVYFVEERKIKITHILKRGSVYDALE